MSLTNHTPKISIITVVYNGADVLEGTIKSVLAQTYPNIEYLIIDGKSKDTTLAIIEKYAPQLAFWSSESDKGLYNAMNKGLRRATGDFVWFMNAGDHIATPETVANIVACCTETTDVLFGEVTIVDGLRKPLGTRSALSTQKLPERLTWQSLRFGMVVSHQGFLPRRSIAPEYMHGNLAADIDWVIVCLKRARTITHTHLTIADFQTGGISSQRHQQSLGDRFEVLSQHFGYIPTVFAHIYITFRAVFGR
jgi:glycosyltransferase involved in cell wall biosynthesis